MSNSYSANAHNAIHHPIGILDTGDNYIICLKDDKTYNDAIQLYESMELEIKEISTESRATFDNLKFIHETIGRVITYGLFVDADPSRDVTNSGYITERLVRDITLAADFARTKMYWTNRQYPPKQIPLVTSVVDGYSCVNYTNSSLIEVDNKILFDDRSYMTIFYNTIYNLAIIKENDSKRSCAYTALAQDISDNFPDFVIAIDIKNALPESVKTAFYNIFHKKSFESVAMIKNKYAAFCDLFGLGGSNDDEQDKVHQFLNKNFIMSTDVDKRMKANELYKAVINHMCIDFHDVVTFKKRLAGYFVDFNLQKKRYADAYYFYGIEAKPTILPSMSAILKQRAMDKLHDLPVPSMSDILKQ